MKTRNYFIAASIMVAAIALAIVSCKKETANTLNQKANETQAFDFRQINDMNAYLANFKAKMFESKSDEAYSLNDAAWHLASLANRDFCNASIKYDNVQFDTVKMNVTITDGTVLLTDLGAAYEQMCTIIRQFKSGFTHDNQILYFINMFINVDGNARIALMTTYATPAKDLDDHHWYFPDIFGYVDSVCLYHFDSNSQYAWDGYGKTELQARYLLHQHVLDIRRIGNLDVMECDQACDHRSILERLRRMGGRHDNRLQLDRITKRLGRESNSWHSQCHASYKNPARQEYFHDLLLGAGKLSYKIKWHIAIFQREGHNNVLVVEEDSNVTDSICLLCPIGILH